MEPARPLKFPRPRCNFHDNPLSKNMFSGWNGTRPTPLIAQNRRGDTPWQNMDHE